MVLGVASSCADFLELKAASLFSGLVELGYHAFPWYVSARFYRLDASVSGNFRSWSGHGSEGVLRGPQAGSLGYGCLWVHRLEAYATGAIFEPLVLDEIGILF